VQAPALAFGGAQLPGPEPIAGPRARLERLNAGRHAAGLHAASHGPGTDPGLWDFLPYGPFADAAAFAAWTGAMAAAEDPWFYAVVDAAGGRPLGMASYLRAAPEHGTIEIGHIWFGAALQRTAAATEAIFLLARHAFDVLRNRRLEWKCDAANARSRRAAERFGFSFEGVFRQHMVVKGRNRDTAWYAMLDREWPDVRAAFERWLDPANFHAGGAQRSPLAARRSPAPPG
jgi:RimJ/RimL family protein N-acetyltransferase